MLVAEATAVVRNNIELAKRCNRNIDPATVFKNHLDLAAVENDDFFHFGSPWKGTPEMLDPRSGSDPDGAV